MLRVAIRNIGQLLPFFFGKAIGKCDLNLGEQIACRSIGRPDAVAFDAEPRAAGRIRRYRERDRPLRRGHIDFAAERGFGKRDGHANIEPIAGAAKKRMRTDMDREQDVAGRGVARSGNRPGRGVGFFCRRRCRRGFLL